MILGPLRVILEPIPEFIGRANELLHLLDLLWLNLRRGGRCLAVLPTTICAQERRADENADDYKKTQ